MSFYVTTPIYYVNAAPHLGHAYTSIAADVLARHHRALGEETFFLTGTDEHGEPVTLAAAAEGVSPQELVDRNAERFRALTGILELSNDFFIRTTDPEHMRLVAEFLQRVYDNGHVYRGFYEGWYCPRCADFKTESEIGPGNTCPIHLIDLIREREETWFFRLSAFQQQLEQLYAEHPDFVLPAHAFNEVRSFVSRGLVDVSLSRATLTWGVPVPWEPDHVFYVWFDALLNYLTALGYARPGESLAHLWPPQLQVLGKDISKFHAIYWPALLLAAGYELPHQLFVHGFLLGPDDAKMSKSRGNVLDPFAIIASRGADALRHYLFREVTFGQDGAVSQEGFEARYEAELANEYGNLASRVLNMLARWSEGRVPTAATDPELVADFAGLFERVDELLGRAELSIALEEIWQRVRRLNRYVEERAPWALARDSERAQELAIVLASLAEGLRVVTVALSPYMPVKTAVLLDALGLPPGNAPRSFAAQGWGGAVSAIAPLFPEGGPGGVIDSHTHLDACEPPNGELVAAAEAVGVTRMLTVGTDPDSCRAALAAAAEHAGVHAAIGCHPNLAERLDEALLRELASDSRCVAVGKTGLDYYRDGAPRELQRRAFEAQIALARELGKPLVIHTREAQEDTLALLEREAGGVRVILHCFSIPEQLDRCLDAGYWISFAGNVTYPSAARLAAAAALVPADRLLIETDAPYLAPQSRRGRPNEPAAVVETARFVADVRGVELAALEAAVERNAAELFGW